MSFLPPKRNVERETVDETMSLNRRISLQKRHDQRYVNISLTREQGIVNPGHGLTGYRMKKDTIDYSVESDIEKSTSSHETCIMREDNFPVYQAVFERRTNRRDSGDTVKYIKLIPYNCMKRRKIQA